MEKEKVLIGSFLCDIDDIWQYGNLLKITLDKNVDIDELTSDMSIFDNIQLLTRGLVECGSFANYNTIYKLDGQIITLSNDGSVYKDPVVIEPDPVPEYVPTLEEVQKNKISELSQICNQLINAGVDLEIDGEMQHFSYKKDEDQTKIKEMFDIAVQTGMDIPYHNDSGSCRLYTAEQIINLYIAQQTNYVHNETYFNQMRTYILSLDDKEIISAIRYGDELTGTYLDNYNIIMTHSAKLVQAMLNKGNVIPEDTDNSGTNTDDGNGETDSSTDPETDNNQTANENVDNPIIDPDVNNEEPVIDPDVNTDNPIVDPNDVPTITTPTDPETESGNGEENNGSIITESDEPQIPDNSEENTEEEPNTEMDDSQNTDDSDVTTDTKEPTVESDENQNSTVIEETEDEPEIR